MISPARSRRMMPRCLGRRDPFRTGERFSATGWSARSSNLGLGLRDPSAHCYRARVLWPIPGKHRAWRRGLLAPPGPLPGTRSRASGVDTCLVVSSLHPLRDRALQHPGAAHPGSREANMPKQYRLPYTLRAPSEETEDMYLAEVPVLPGCRAWGATAEEALFNLEGVARTSLPPAKTTATSCPLPSPEPVSSWLRFDLPGTDPLVASARLRVRPTVARLSRNLAQSLQRRWRVRCRGGPLALYGHSCSACRRLLSRGKSTRTTTGTRSILSFRNSDADARSSPTNRLDWIHLRTRGRRGT